VIALSQRTLLGNKQHSQQTNIHAPGGIRFHSLSRRAAAELRLGPCGHWDRLILSYSLMKLFTTTSVTIICTKFLINLEAAVNWMVSRQCLSNCVLSPGRTSNMCFVSLQPLCMTTRRKLTTILEVSTESVTFKLKALLSEAFFPRV
jgi:hypothetical protein